jgi:hypothetical protein
MQAIGGLREGLRGCTEGAADRLRVRHGRSRCRLLHLLIVACLEFSGRHVANRFEQSPVVEPIDPPEGGEFDGLEMTPGAFQLNHFRLEEPDDRFSERVVVGVAAAADRWRDAGFCESLRVPHRQVLRAAVAVMHQVGDAGGAPIVNRLLERIEDEVGPRDDETRQPTMRRANTSIMKATYAKPRHVAT